MAVPVVTFSRRAADLALAVSAAVVVLLTLTPTGHGWASQDEVDVDDFVATPMVVRDPSANTRRVVEEALAERGLSLTAPLAEVGSTSAAKATALSEGAPVLLSRLAVGPADAGAAADPPAARGT